MNNNLKHFTIGLSMALVLLLFTLSQHYVRAENVAIKGTIVDDANCTVEKINEVNSKHFYDKVSKLVTKTFFKIFKVDLASECPFWAMKVMCGTEGGCSVCKCDEKEIPIPWKITTQNKVNTFLGASLGNQRWVDDNKNVWFPKPLEESKMTYVNLLMNPESNTGYSGSEAARVWKAIYTENCFKEGNLQDMCFEERVFFRLISGLHTSITLKIATYFHKRIPIPTDPNAEPTSKHNSQVVNHDDQAISTNGQIINPQDYFSPNLDFYKYRIAPFQDRLRNMYFLYTFTLRAVQKAEKVLRNYDYNTGNDEEDRETKKLVHQLLDTTGICDPTFDESLLFRSSEKSFLREQMRNHFRNISSIMDCVACEKCRMWAKLEMLGLATAFKIVLADDKSSYQNLQRNEIIALMNSFNQLSRSIHDLDRLNNMLWRKEMAPYVAYTMTGVIGLAVLRFLWIMVTSRRSKFVEEDKKKK